MRHRHPSQPIANENEEEEEEEEGDSDGDGEGEGEDEGEGDKSRRKQRDDEGCEEMGNDHGDGCVGRGDEGAMAEQGAGKGDKDTQRHSSYIRPWQILSGMPLRFASILFFVVVPVLIGLVAVSISNKDSLRGWWHTCVGWTMRFSSRGWPFRLASDHHLLRSRGSPSHDDYESYPSDSATFPGARRESECALPFQLLWMAPFLSGGGYCSEAIAYLTALKSVTVDLRNLRIAQHGDGINVRFWNGLAKNIRTMISSLMNGRYEPASSTVVICHSEPGAWYPPLFQTSPCPPDGYASSMYVIGRTMFETDRVSPGHVERLNRMDEVWVPTQFHVNTFVKSGVDKAKVFKVVQPVDVEVFDPVKSKAFPLPIGVRVFGEKLGKVHHTIPGNNFVFLSIFKWELRKGWDVLIKAYLQEFSAKDNTILYLLTNPYHSDSDFDRKVRAVVGDLGIREPDSGWASVHILDTHIPQENLPGLYKAADAFVLPSRGEGWGRPHVEAMAMGLPVIATNWSGMTEYMTDANSYPLPIDGLVKVKEGPFDGHLWAEPSVDALRRIMRQVLENPKDAREKGSKAREDMVERFSPAVVGAQVMKELWRIARSVGDERYLGQRRLTRSVEDDEDEGYGYASQ